MAPSNDILRSLHRSVTHLRAMRTSWMIIASVVAFVFIFGPNKRLMVGVGKAAMFSLALAKDGHFQHLIDLAQRGQQLALLHRATNTSPGISMQPDYSTAAAADHTLRVACFGFWSGGEDCRKFVPASVLPMFFRNVEIELVDVEDRPDILFVSVFAGEAETKQVLNNSKEAFRISFSGEVRNYAHFEEGLLDLILGFDCPPRMLTPCVRFPLWISYIATPACVIRNDFFQFQNLTAHAWASRPCFASLVSRHGGYPRDELFDAFSEIGFVAAPGTFKHNSNFSSELPDGSQQKIELLSHCRYNICPENDDKLKYVTEKLFHAAWSGAIPVYWGQSIPEPGILNPQRILNLSPSDNLTMVIERVKALERDPAERMKFFASPLIVPEAQTYVSRMCASYISQVSKRFPHLPNVKE